MIDERVWYDSKGRRRVQRIIEHEVEVRLSIPEEPGPVFPVPQDFLER